MDELLKRYGLKYEELNSAERETLNNWMDAMQKGGLSIERIKQYIENMRDAVAVEVSNYENGTRQDLYVKARLRNYTLLLGFLSTPEKAKEQFERALGNLKKSGT